VEVWVTPELFDQFTWSPALIVTLAGLNAKLTMATCVVLKANAFPCTPITSAIATPSGTPNRARRSIPAPPPTDGPYGWAIRTAPPRGLHRGATARSVARPDPAGPGSVGPRLVLGRGPPHHADPRRRHRTGGCRRRQAGGGGRGRGRRVGHPGGRRRRRGGRGHPPPRAGPGVDPFEPHGPQGTDHHAGGHRLPQRQRGPAPRAGPVRRGPPRDRPGRHPHPARGRGPGGDPREHRGPLRRDRVRTRQPG